MLTHTVPGIVGVEIPSEKQPYLSCVCRFTWGESRGSGWESIQSCSAQSCIWDQFICSTKAFHCVSEKASMGLNPLATYLQHFYARLCCVPPRSISPAFSLLLDW